jgi:cation transporter-like permease
MIYGLLYEAMLAWYKQRGIEERYLRAYVTITLTALAFINVLSVLAFLAYVGVGFARLFFLDLSWEIALGLIVVLLAIHVVYLKAHSGLKPENGVGNRWIAPGYIFASIAVACYASTLVSAFNR